MSDARRRLRRLSGGLGRMSGFALSIALLAIASLAAIPVMVSTEGGRAWGAIALGQAVGAIAGATVGYGWGVSGPARVAVADPPVRRTAYIESVRARLVLFPVCALIAAVVSAGLAPEAAGLAALAAITTSAAGITANWYFVGVRAPYALLLAETVPRVLGTVAGIVAMLLGAGALVGLSGMLAGMLAAFVCSTWWILARSRAHRSDAPAPAPVSRILADQRHGMGTAVGSAVYIALPLVIVTLVAPAAQPVFALVDKLQRQISVALQPAITVAQGWVPHRMASQSAGRVRGALIVGSALAAFIGLTSLALGHPVLTWLGGGHIDVTAPAVVLMAAFVAVNFFESLVAKAALPSLGRMRIGAMATIVSAVIALPLVAAGAALWGAVGALAAVVVGLIARGAVEVAAAARTIRTHDRIIIREGIDA